MRDQVLWTWEGLAGVTAVVVRQSDLATLSFRLDVPSDGDAFAIIESHVLVRIRPEVTLCPYFTNTGLPAPDGVQGLTQEGVVRSTGKMKLELLSPASQLTASPPIAWGRSLTCRSPPDMTARGGQAARHSPRAEHWAQSGTQHLQGTRGHQSWLK